ncbi:MAG: type II CAAX endopeptidase family protein [Bacteroidota bacterium]|nr:type II CAAX endopeptidase family protein [Bacteroidota bacterium]
MERPHTPLTNKGTFFLNAGGELRAVWKLSAYVCTAIAGFALFYTIGSFLTSAMDVGMRFVWLSSHTAMLAAACTATVFVMSAIDRRPFADIGFHLRHGALRDLVLGVGVAGVMISLLGLAALCSGLTDVRLAVASTPHGLHVLAGGAMLFLVVSLAEEILLRGYPFLVMERSLGPLAAVLITSVVFAFFHVWNPHIDTAGFVNIFLAGLWLGRARLVSGALWLPVGLHMGWNFFLGSVWGFPVSGVLEPAVFHAVPRGEERLTGGLFGPEAGLFATGILIVGLGLLFEPHVVRFFHAGRPEGTWGRTGEKTTSSTSPE